MAYEKRICVLRQIKKGFSADGTPLTGVVYAERLGNELTVTPRIAGLSPVREGRYVLFLWAEGRTFCLELRGNAAIAVADAPSVRGGFAALLCFVRGEPTPVAFGTCGAAPARYTALLEEESPKKRKIPAVPMPPNELPLPVAPNVPHAPAPPLPDPVPEEVPPREERAAARYHDEAIAETDYFRTAGDGNEKTPPPPREEKGAAAPADAGDLLARPRGSLTYYYEVKEKIDAAFGKYPRDNSLLAAFPRSEWVKTEGALLGVVYQGGVPRYLCVAAAGRSDGAPPQAMKEHAVFVPKDAFSETEGFWVVFQDADTGEYVETKSG